MILIRLLAVLMVFALPQQAFAAQLQMPYARPAFAGATISEKKFVCPPVPSKGTPDLVLTGIYDKNDPEKDDANASNKAQYRKETRAMAQFENKLLALTNAYYVAQPNTAAPKARCALAWMHEWASKNAMLGTVNYVGISVRHWTLASLSSAYGQIRDEESLNAEENIKVRAWLRALAYAVIADYDAPKNKRENNLAYWAAWSVTMTGIALNDYNLYQWGMKRGMNAIGDIAADGTLPLEMERGSKALLYHQFALTPLLMLAEAGVANGFNMYDLNNGYLHRLAKRVLVGIETPAFFQSRTGYEQDSTETLSAGHMAWIAVYHARYPSYRTRVLISRYQPLISRRLGGDMTLLFGRGS